jgi:hypothetical protein
MRALPLLDCCSRRDLYENGFVMFNNVAVKQNDKIFRMVLLICHGKVQWGGSSSVGLKSDFLENM